MEPTASRENKAPNWLLWAIIIVGIVTGSILLLPTIHQGSGGHSRRSSCMNNLRQFGIALHNYHDVYKTFPPAFVAGPDGKPMHTWRVLLLPFFEEQGLKELHSRYDFNEPWNGPHNIELSKRIPPVFCCPSAENHLFGYLAVAGPETVWPGSKGISLKAITDGRSQTIAVVEVADSGINWLEPRDLTFEQAAQGINVSKAKLGISSHHPGGANILFCDGSVHFLSNGISPDVLRALLTAAGGENVPIPN
jgi:prepilin-type processing-associated H-X9-DG protein